MPVRPCTCSPLLSHCIVWCAAAGETGASTARLGQEVHTNGPQLDDRILADADVQVGIAGLEAALSLHLSMPAVAGPIAQRSATAANCVF